MDAFDGVSRNVSHDIWNQLNSYQLPKWGFVVMRCTYSDNEAWKECMRRLEAVIQQCFDTNDEIDVQVLARHDWSVQEDLALANGPQGGASKDAIRRRFKHWADTAGRAEYASTDAAVQAAIKACIPRFSHCIAIDTESMESILADPMSIFEGRLLLGTEAYVNVIRADDDWYEMGLPDFDTFDWSQHSDEVYDEGEEEIEGSRLHDVGWMKFRLSDLHLEFWRHLSDTFSEWDALYVRPNEGMAMEY